MDLAWLLSPPWDWVVIAAALGVVGLLLSWYSLGAHHRRHAFGRALEFAILRTIGWGLYDRWLS